MTAVGVAAAGVEMAAAVGVVMVAMVAVVGVTVVATALNICLDIKLDATS